MPDISVELAPRHKSGLRLKNPVMVASGTFGYGTEYAKLFDIERLGAIVCKGTTLRPRRGNPQNRTAETPAGMLNTIGLQNIGVDALIREKAPIWSTWDVPVIVNIAGESVAEYAELATRLEGVPGVAGLEVNISCPNVAAGGMAFGVDCPSASEVTRAVRRATSLPVIVKLTPNVTDIQSIARAVVDAGADAVSLINTLRGMRIDIQRRRPALSMGTGGLSGPAVLPVALAMVYQVAQAVDVPIVGMGGIAGANDALEFILAGATAVAVGTMNFVQPDVTLNVIDGIRNYLERSGVSGIEELVGTAQPRAMK